MNGTGTVPSPEIYSLGVFPLFFTFMVLIYFPWLGVLEDPEVGSLIVPLRRPPDICLWFMRKMKALFYTLKQLWSGRRRKPTIRVSAAE